MGLGTDANVRNVWSDSLAMVPRLSVLLCQSSPRLFRICDTTCRLSGKPIHAVTRPIRRAGVVLEKDCSGAGAGRDQVMHYSLGICRQCLERGGRRLPHTTSP